MNERNEQEILTFTLDKLKRAFREVLAEAALETNPRSFLSPDQVAEELQLEPRLIREICTRGELKSYKVGKFIRIERKDLNDFLSSCDRTS
ncbi:helix-turn-helix domain-containing protein [Chryseolinea sp. T2]|uniref:helix-turn-helix domain-containing protein n=1 Tax=Chryseolinea sp. T2 TaxID=3129255 RepID=UPI003FCCABB8